MKKATRTLEINKAGKNVRFNIVAERGVIDMADRSEGFEGHFETFKSDEVAVYVDGKLFDKGELQDYRPTMHMPGLGLPMGASGKIGSKMLLSAEMLDQLLVLVAEARAEAETDEEYSALKAKNEAKKAEAKKAEAARVVAAFEAGKCLKSYAEAKRYNNVHNEGGDGYVPEVITIEMYQAAREAI
jgi:hypothetical protein